ncbi:MAG: hypothetical protein AB7O65_09820 [Candidatus Korobacteraceae bacterium]
MPKNRLSPMKEEAYVPHTKPRTAAQIWAEFEDVYSGLPEHEQLRMKRVFYSGLQSLLWDFELIPNRDTDPDAVNDQVARWYDEVSEVEAALIADAIGKNKIGGGVTKPNCN